MPVNSIKAATVVCPFLLHHAVTTSFIHMSACTHALHAVPSLTPTSSAGLPFSAQQGPKYKAMKQEPGKLRAANSHANLQYHVPFAPLFSTALCVLHTPPGVRQFEVLPRTLLGRSTQRASIVGLL
jgi:hypothetical protein